MVHRRLLRSLLLATFCTSAPAFAQTTAAEKAAAEALFDDGLELMRRGEFEPACVHLEKSQRIDPAVGTLLYLAECYEKTGRTASAWATFREAASAAEATGQDERAKVGEQRAQKLEPQLSRLTIAVADANRSIPGLAVRRQRLTIAPAVGDTPVPADPGEQVIVASAPGHESFEQTVTVRAGATSASVEVPPLRKLDEPSPAPTPPAPAAAASSPPASSTTLVAARPDAPASSAGTSQRTLAYVLGGVGVVGLGVGSFFGLQAFDKNSEAEEACPVASRCTDPAGEELTNDAKSAATISTIAFAAGTAALAVGVVLYLTAPDSPESPPGASLSAHLGPGNFSLRGSF